MTYCHVSAQCDAHARQLSEQQAAEDAVERQMDGIDRDYGWRLRELADALSDVISEDDLNQAIAVYRDSSRSITRPREPKINPKYRLTIIQLFNYKALHLGRLAASDLTDDCFWQVKFDRLHDEYRQMFGVSESEKLKKFYEDALAAETQLRRQKEGEDQ